MKAKRFIDVTTEVRKELKKIFKCSSMNVWRALNFEGQSDECKRIRVAALQKGGLIMVSWPECETIHDEGTGEMIQVFENGARLVVNKRTGYCVVYYPNGDPHMGWRDVTVQQLEALQEIAAGL